MEPGCQVTDFTLPGLDGRPWNLSGQRGRCIVLFAWSSW